MKKLSLFAFGFVLFGTQAFAAETTYTMEEAVKKALLDNRSIISAQKSAEASKSALYSARGAFGPSVTASYAVSHDPYSDFQKSLLQGKDLDETTYTFGVEVRQPLFQGFQLLNNAQKAKLQSEYDELQLKKQISLSPIKFKQRFCSSLWRKKVCRARKKRCAAPTSKGLLRRKAIK